MIQGVHAETIALVDFRHAASVLQVPGWTWLGVAGQFSTRRVRMTGTPPRDGGLRVSRVSVMNQAATCRVQLESQEGVPGTALIRGDVSLAPAPGGNATTRCVLSFRGLVARNLADVGGPASAEATRRLANEYARSLLEQIAANLERVSTAGAPPEPLPPSSRIVPPPKKSTSDAAVTDH